MSITLSALQSKTSISFFVPNIYPRINHSNHSLSLAPPCLTVNAKPLTKLRNPQNFYGSFNKCCVEFLAKSRGFAMKAENGSGFSSNTEEDEMEARGESSMPQRFRYLTKEAPDKPVRWPWLVVLAFMVYAWRAVVWELFNWRRAIMATGRFMGYIVKLVLALILHFIGDPLTYSIGAVETALYAIRAFYSSIISAAPIRELATIIMLASAVLSVAESAVPGSVDSQPYVLTLAGLIGLAAVRSLISEVFFWTLLVGVFGFGRLVKRRDYVSSWLPAAAVLAGVGEPWVRVVVMGSYLGLAVFHHGASGPADLKGGGERGVRKGVPFGLLCLGLAIGMRVGAKWAGYRHLTWMIV